MEKLNNKMSYVTMLSLAIVMCIIWSCTSDADNSDEIDTASAVDARIEYLAKTYNVSTDRIAVNGDELRLDGDVTFPNNNTLYDLYGASNKVNLQKKTSSMEELSFDDPTLEEAYQDYLAKKNATSAKHYATINNVDVTSDIIFINLYVGGDEEYDINGVSFDLESLTSYWIDAFEDAIDLWHDEPLCKLEFIPVVTSRIFDKEFISSIGIINVAVSDDVEEEYDDEETVPIALASWPTFDGRPGNLIRISQIAKDAPGLNDDQGLNVAVHEIGHCLGFRHTDMYLHGEDASATDDLNTKSGAALVVTLDDDCNNEADCASIFSKGLTDNSCNGEVVTEFSMCDRLAIYAVYGQ